MADFLDDEPVAEGETADDGEGVEHEYRELLDKIEAREKEFKDGWWKQAEAAVSLYDSDKVGANGQNDTTPYNILYSNTEVLLPSLYSSTPKPDVRTRFKGQDLKPIPELVERYLTVLSDPSNPGTEDLDGAMAENVLSSLTAGMGFVRLRHYPDRPIPITFEAGHYKGLIWGKARKWSKVPWIAFRHELTKDEFFAQFKIADEAKAKFTDTEDDSTTTGEKGEQEKFGSTVVYEYWNKAERKICFLCPDWQGILVEEGKDTLKLQDFFPLPGMLLLTLKPGKLVPIPLYVYYQNQAEELNRVTVRLNRVLSAIRVRGAYNGLLGEDMKTILQDGELENALIPAKEAGMLAQNGGFDRHIWLLPIEKLIIVAQQLYAARQQIKQVIYELTGISDIIRGSSVASETATAQDLKNKWGTVRLRKMQGAVAEYVRDLYRLAVDAGTEVIKPKDWLLITQLPIATSIQKQQAQQQMQMLTMQAQQAMQMGQQPKPPDPKILKAAQEPSIEELLAKIKDDANRTFTINVQSNSTVDLDTAQDKQEVQEFMNAMGQLLSGLGPLAQLGPTGLEAAKQILVSVCQRFKFGLQIVDSIQGIQPPPPPQEKSPELDQKEKDLAQKEQQLTQAEQKLVEQKSQLEDILRQIETAKKEFASQVKIANAEAAAREQVFAAKQATAQAQAGAQHVQRKSEMVVADVSRKEQQAKETVQKVQSQQPDMKPVVQAVTQLQEMMGQLAQIVEQVSRKPKRLIKGQDGSWTPEF